MLNLGLLFVGKNLVKLLTTLRRKKSVKLGCNLVELYAL